MNISETQTKIIHVVEEWYLGKIDWWEMDKRITDILVEAVQ